MIAQFPIFSNLDLSHKAEIEAITASFPPYSDFNFVSLFCWNTDGSTAVSVLHDNLVIKLPDYLTGDTVYSLLGSHSIEESLLELLKIAPSLKLVPEATVNSLTVHDGFNIEEDRDNFDYIYDLGAVAILNGQRYKKIRNKLNSFNNWMPSNLVVRNLQELDSNDKAQLLALFDKWAEHAEQSKEESAAERIAFSRLLEHTSYLNLLFTTLSLDSSVVGASINELLPHQQAICHFEKSIPYHQNIFSFLTNEAAKALREKEAKYVNWEQDLGIEGLRKSKMSYRPQMFLKKYTISLSK